MFRSLVDTAEGKTVIDLGCGTGGTLDIWREFRPQRLIGLDFSHEMLNVARSRHVELIHADCCVLPIGDSTVDIASCCLTLGYLPGFRSFVHEMARVVKPGGLVIISELHPEAVERFGWNRAFPAGEHTITVRARAIPLLQVQATFAEAGLHAEIILELSFGPPERDLFTKAGKLEHFQRYKDLPALYMMRFQRREDGGQQSTEQLSLTGARVACSASTALTSQLDIFHDRLQFVGNAASANTSSRKIDLSGFMLLPGLINAHDHLEFALFPRLGRGGYGNGKEWATDIYRPRESPIREHLNVPKWVRLWWGGIRNLLAGVTTVCHHNPYEPAIFNDDFPVRVVREFRWAHSVQFDSDISAKHQDTSLDIPFIIHLAEGVDEASSREIVELERMGALDHRTVIVHGIGLNEKALNLVSDLGAGLIWCPSSNHFLFDQTLSSRKIGSLARAALGSDSPMTSVGDFLDELRFALRLGAAPQQLYDLSTSNANRTLRLRRGEGRLLLGNIADVVAVRDDGSSPAERLVSLSYRDVELVIVGGKVRLVSEELRKHLPDELTVNLELLIIDGTQRWISAPVSKLLGLAREALGPRIIMQGRELSQ